MGHAASQIVDRGGSGLVIGLNDAQIVTGHRFQMGVFMRLFVREEQRHGRQIQMQVGIRSGQLDWHKDQGLWRSALVVVVAAQPGREDRSEVIFRTFFSVK
jgi:hypothetical protein